MATDESALGWPAPEALTAFGEFGTSVRFTASWSGTAATGGANAVVAAAAGPGTVGLTAGVETPAGTVASATAPAAGTLAAGEGVMAPLAASVVAGPVWNCRVAAESAASG
ncbi:MAG TPA: hypothetical protein VK695_06475 [Steroidobacteraceae bacterium]|nr:hypothetical protein [Steroidobacteraceae bacterium]